MIQASRSPSSPSRSRSTWHSGPLRIGLVAPGGRLNDLIARTLGLYDVRWSLTPLRPVTLHARIVEATLGPPAEGSYLECAQMLVDTVPDGLRATTIGGAVLDGRLTATGEHWELAVPGQVCDAGRWVEVEDLLSLVVTTGWRRGGWVPLHAAGLTRNGRGVIVCAAGRGGKTTFTVAMVRRGWQTLGDDKLLLGSVDDRTIIGGLKHVLNLDPQASAWFPEVGDIAGEPAYSTSSPKRRVPLARFWPAAPASSMAPTHLVVVERRRGGRGISVARLGMGDVIGALLRQTVIPKDPALARPMARSLAALAQRVMGLRVDVSDGAYSAPQAMEAVEAALS